MIVVILIAVIVLALPILAVTAVRRHYTSWYVYRKSVPAEATREMRDEVTAAGIVSVKIVADDRNPPPPQWPS
jgi:hypothetical protein